MIEPAIWPERTRSDAGGHLLIGDHDLTDLAARYGTPLYVYDAATIRSSVRAFRTAFAPHAPMRIAYSVKACALVGVGAVLARLGVDASVASLGELLAARRGGFAAVRTELHGNAKPDDELRAALAARVGRIVIDGAHEIERLSALVKRRPRRQPVWLRVSPGIQVETHPHLVTGTLDSKFGAPLLGGEALAQARAIASTPGLALVGVHAHLGAQLRRAARYGELAGALVAFAREVRDATGAVVRELGMGGGFATPVRGDELIDGLDEFARAIAQPVRRDPVLARATIYIEPGRGLVGRAAVALYRVIGTKRVPGVRTFVAVDGGMGDNIRPALYGAEYTAVVATRALEQPSEEVAVAGRYCESGDILIRSVALPAVSGGDVLAVPAVGAYSVSMASNYNSVGRPAVVLLDRGRARLIRRRERPADLWRLERR